MDFKMNACVPTYSTSRMSYLPNSRVRLSNPITTKNGNVFSSLVVNYELGGEAPA
jgi:hypothetical protein